jgi:large subunit ribosomal protein L24
MRLTFQLLARKSVTDQIGELTKKWANFPEAYLKRTVEQVEWKTPDLPNYLPREVKRRRVRFTMNRPWSPEFDAQNRDSHRNLIPVQPIKDWMFFKGDRVEVLTGRDKGKIGLVSQVIQERNWVVVAGLNWHFRRIGQKGQEGNMLVRSEAPLLVTHQVSLVDPSDDKMTKVEWRFTEEGERVRVSLRTGRIIPLPLAADETHDYKDPSSYLENESKDTTAKEVEAITFDPKLKTFEMEIMEVMDIKEDRVPKKSYWY